ncbi:GPI transamidase subunit PIG-U [Kockiozyma suomiensis]|uniref:GPI transamidase subunit PIG-U n=1 Tax=Kockiozyma suomiensis TaxID=1337062 RepID=UPI00334433D3
MDEQKRLLNVCIAAVLLRAAISIGFPAIHGILDQRVELTTASTSFKQLREGLHLYRMGVSPFDGGVYHQAPLLILIFQALDGFYGSIAPNSLAINVVYCVLDVLCAWFLVQISTSESFSGRKKLDSWNIAAIYLFNPLVIATNLARSTAVFSNVLILAAIRFATYSQFLSVLFLAAASHLNIYAVYLVPPFMILWSPTKAFSNCAVTVLLYAAAFGGLSLLGYFMSGGSFQYIKSTYGTLLFFSDLVPNMGLWWYFFMEIFDSFRPLFTYIFQLYSLIYVLPITIRLQKEPLFAIVSILGVTLISKAYPELGDLGIYISLLSLYQHIFTNVRYALLSALVIIHALVLAPNFYHLWIYLGSGNANFFYAISLVYAIGVTLILTDTLRAILRIEFDGGEEPQKVVVQI